MLPETALVKLMWCLGQTKDREKALHLMKANLAGEHGDRTTYAEASD
jgi:glutamyl-tRNA(Gln) amidotransferase subunit D